MIDEHEEELEGEEEGEKFLRLVYTLRTRRRPHHFHHHHHHHIQTPFVSITTIATNQHRYTLAPKS